MAKRYEEYVGCCVTVKDLTFTVTGVGKDVRERNTLILNCPVCSLDKELWPEGSIQSAISSLNRGRLPCGCSTQVGWSETQNRIRVERSCREKGLVFLGWDGEYKRGKTRLRLMNPDLNYCWNKTVLNYLVNTVHKCCPLSKDIGNSVCIDKRVSNFMNTGSFKKGTVFIKDDGKVHKDGRKCYWKVQCPSCKEDEFCKEGLCDGWFYSTTSALNFGQVPCRCSSRHHYTDVQWGHRVGKVITEKGGFVETQEFKDSRCLVEWRCKRGHYNKDRAGIITNRCVCGTCGKMSEKFGYYPHKRDDLDNLYILRMFDDFGNDFIKIGRTFDFKQRSYEYKKLFTVEILDMVSTETHHTVFHKELHLKGILKDKLVIFDFGFGGSSEECFTKEILSHPEIISTFNLQ